DANRLFRYAGDTVEVGSTRGYAYAVLEAGKDGTASGLIDTSLLKPGSSEMVVYPGRSKITGSRSTVGESTVDTTEFGVEEGRLS
ncbi:MAG: hypothetical protein SV760_08875, partial [Halobacteria archaeon]|nr:hypothetical protein [Halobacteria archaeon]